MAKLSFAEVSAASRNALLSAKICKALRQLKRGAALDSQQLAVLTRGADLISGAVQGSLLIERRPLEEHGARADLKAYTLAVSALEALQQVAANRDATDTFKRYRDDLSRLAAGRNLDAQKLEQLLDFFSLLNQFFYKDVQRTPPPVRMEPALSLMS